MTNRYETLDHYLSVCRLHKKEVSKLIKTILENKTQIEPVVKTEKMNLNNNLNLRGNNYFLDGIKLGNDDAFCLYHTLKINSWVFNLDLRFNNLGDEGATWIAKLISENSTLKFLNLMCNEIGPDGAEQIALALQKNTSIVYLNLNGNKIGNKGGMCMAQMLQVNTTLQYLDIGETDLKIESLIALATILNYNRTLKSLNVSRPVPQFQFANWMDEIAQHFANMLKVNQTLKQLIMKKFEMRDYGIHWISDKLLSNFHLVHLDLSW
ncbi:leucine-rich repeat-containing 34-like isoform X1 [Brachionus plicatilis]|uniref:Leucine-rich repeat-containing 34-like isoform X1 n=1 Tax=Brachionus plicatilis TaxID=10195 RepID=A0A3M7P664_BRAPC|nr:leucine-rich repeat-containing 34-like isoform X1 [Brachionus plicatilis]